MQKPVISMSKHIKEGSKNTFLYRSSFVLLLLAPCKDSFANGIPAYAGTAIMHVLFINVAVIIAESFLLIHFSKSKTLLLRYIILANLVSLFAAYPFTDYFIHTLSIDQWFGLSKNGTITKQIFLLGAAIFVALTIIIESPFYYLATKKELSFFKSFKLCVLINLATNVTIALFYILTNSYQPIAD